MRASFVALALVLVCAGPALAQPPEPIGPFVVDARAMSGALPAAEGWTPVLPPNTPVPSRGLGFELGGHAYFGPTGSIRFGAGASLALSQSASSPTQDTSPEVTTRVTALAPQFSLNFGHRLGWSYLSVGYGGVKVTSESAPLAGVPAASEDSGWTGALNFGGGARWFITEHLGVGFDARWHRLSSREASATLLAAPGTTLLNLAVGVSIR